MANERKGKLYFSFIAGPCIGFEFLSDDEGGTAFALHLLILRVLWTKDDLTAERT